MSQPRQGGARVEVQIRPRGVADAQNCKPVADQRRERADPPPGDPGGCSFLLCDIPSDPAQFVAGGLNFGPGVGVDIGNSLSNGCRTLTDPVAGADLSGRLTSRLRA